MSKRPPPFPTLAPPPHLADGPRQHFVRFARALAERGDLHDSDRGIILGAALMAWALESEQSMTPERLVAVAGELRRHYTALGLRYSPDDETDGAA